MQASLSRRWGTTADIPACRIPRPFPLWAPEGVQGASGKPPGRLRRGESFCDTEESKEGSFPLPSTRNLFLVGGFVRLRADEVLSHTGKYPKGAGGGQRVHVSWPPPDPPLLRNSAPLASQGRAQLGSRPSLGGPLSPTAQLIPPPAPWRRPILGVPARGHCGRTTLQQHASRHRGHARCVPTPAPDWLLAQVLLVSENHAFFPVQMLRLPSRVRHLMK